MTAATCATCPFSHWSEPVGRECRREPLRAVVYPGQTMEYGAGKTDGYVSWGWPPVGKDEWCGEHPARQRDRLATMVVQGLVAEAFLMRTPDKECAARAAERAYRVADAMLREREREPSP